MAIVIPEYGHMGDLGFSNPLDSTAMKDARMTIMSKIFVWILEDRIKKN